MTNSLVFPSRSLLTLCAALLTACGRTNNTAPHSDSTLKSIVFNAVVKRPGSTPQTFKVVGGQSLPVYLDLEPRDQTGHALPMTALDNLKPCSDPAAVRLSDISTARHPHRLRLQFLARGTQNITFVTGTDCTAAGVSVALRGTFLQPHSTPAGDKTYSLALKADGTVVTWGRNDYGQLGNGRTTASAVPVAVNLSSVAIPVP
ncbi:RCC1 domain-containing protein [Deinococcus marmoris]|uniref:RCC1 domain-containing protein n=1 Tax=Deinococcus marmoris TaxID=249408 RepID=UPI00096A9F69|nr:RCC1 domain-containing protein [Deinococcus marmoris]